MVIPTRLSALMGLGASLLLAACSPLARELRTEPTLICHPRDEQESAARFIAASSSSLDSLMKEYARDFRHSLAAAQASQQQSHADPSESSIIGWQPGEQFPTLFLSRKESTLPDLRLGPIMRGQNLFSLSRVSISPDARTIAIIGSNAKNSGDVLVTFDTRSASTEVISRDAHDVLWSSDNLLAYSVRKDGQPRRVYIKTKDNTPVAILETRNRNSALLLSKNRSSSLFFIEESAPHSISLSIYDPHSPRQPIVQFRDEPPGFKCVGERSSLVCLSFRTNPFGDILLFKSLSRATPQILFSGEASRPLVGVDANDDSIIALTSLGTATQLTLLSLHHLQSRSVQPTGPVTTWTPFIDENDPLTLKVRERSFLRPTLTRAVRELFDGAAVERDPPSLCSSCREESFEAIAADGVAIPISLVAPATPKALLVSAYGAYGVSSPAEFSPYFHSLLDNGVAIAIAHVRGGGERGPSWHAAASGEYKLKSVGDLVAAIQEIQRRTSVPAGSTVMLGRSAGGWLVAKTALDNPELIGGAILEAPLVLFADSHTGILDAQDQAEWGGLEALKALYSPTVGPRGLTPPLLLMVPMADSRIAPEDTIRWARQTWCAQQAPAPFFLMALPGVGHDGPNDRGSLDRWMAIRETFIHAMRARSERASLP